MLGNGLVAAEGMDTGRITATDFLFSDQVHKWIVGRDEGSENSGQNKEEQHNHADDGRTLFQKPP
jgi:hypothetical protein